MLEKKKIFGRIMVVAASCLALQFSSVVYADGMPDAPVRKKPKAAVTRTEAPRVEPMKPEVKPEPMPVAEKIYDDSCEWNFRVSPGSTVWFFNKENTLPGASLMMDVWRSDMPWNFHFGIEGRHMYLGQDSAKYGQEWEDKTTRVTYMRIPFALEYMNALNADTTWYIGGGPDIVHTANDITETAVGGHLGTRLHYGFNENWGVSVEAGYMWGRLDGEDKDINLDGAYITPAMAYTF